MRSQAARLFKPAGIAVILICAAAAPSVTIHQADETTLNGTLESMNDGQVVVQAKGSDGKTSQIRIPMQDLAEMTFSAPPPTTSSTSQPDASALWRAILADGTRVTGVPAEWKENHLVLNSSEIAGGALSLPIDRFRELWHGDEAAVAKAIALKVRVGTEDVAYVQKDNQVLSVQGLVQGIDAEDLVFRFNNQDRRIALKRIVGVALAGAPAAKPNTSFHQVIVMRSGDELAGTCQSIDGRLVELQTAWNAAIKIPIDRIAAIRSVNGRLVYLSNLEPVQVEQVPFFDRVMPYQKNRALGGEPLRLADGVHDKGLAVHARCVLRYDIGATYQRFRAEVGFQQPEGRIGRASIRVLGDDRPLFELPDARGEQKPVNVDLKIEGVRRLTLEVDFGKGDGAGARVDWIDARLLRRSVVP